MAKGYKAGGGGLPLNLKVVGNPQPESAKENTIWVDSDTPITGWEFSPVQPEAAEEGMVWFPTDKRSPVAINALKKNGIRLFPVWASQYVGGAWVDVTAKIWQGDKWNDFWNGSVYDSGNEYIPMTGGWELTQSTGSVLSAASKKEESYLAINVYGTTSAAFITKNTIDVRRFSTLNFDCFGGVIQGSFNGNLVTCRLHLFS